MTPVNKDFALIAESNWSTTSALNDRYVCQCSAE